MQIKLKLYYALRNIPLISTIKKGKFAPSYTAKHKFHSENSVALHLHEGPVYREIEIKKKDNKETWNLS